MGLVMKNKICLNTQLGTSEIQLLFGDITKLPVEDKVDVIFISAFPGDYTPVPGTMIGALRKNLDLHVGNIAKDKATDLRQAFNCWVSKPLPDHLPYSRLVCFERMNCFEKLAEQISGIFRAMMPVFNNQDTTVITPLLASGNQGHSETRVLRSIVPAACHWIKAGLPLRCLKIVIYTSNPHATSDTFQELLEVFSELKDKWEKKQSTEVVKVEKTIDVCLSFSNGDEAFVGQICDDLRKLHTKIVIHREELVYDHQAFWQEKIFSIMVNSRKIIAILTPNYVEKPECLEQYNLALCCNRLTGVEVLAPFYLQTVPTFPSYMSLIQYTECRPRKEGEKAEEMIFSACLMLVKDIDMVKDSDPSEALEEPSEVDAVSLMSKGPSDPSSSSVYDVFISYAHKTPKEAHKFYENLLDIDPTLRVFLDRSELRTGNSWQEALYEATDKAKVFVAFISDSYIQSTVCQDEYNIALARYMSSEGIYFVPLLTSSTIKELPVMFSSGPLVDISGLVYEEDHFLLAQAVVNWLESLKAGQLILNRFRLVEPGKKTRISFVTAKWREKDFDKRFKIQPGCTHFELRNPATTAPIHPGNRTTKTTMTNSTTNTTTNTNNSSSTSPQKTVVFSFAQDCFKQAKVLASLLEEVGGGKGGTLSCRFLTSVHSEGGLQAPKLQLLDSADLVVVMVSDDYLESTQHHHELHICLSRQRMNQDQRVVYLIEAHHTRRDPVYARLLHYSVSLGDELWAYLARKLNHDLKPVPVASEDHSGQVSVMCSAGEYLALHTAAMDIHDKLWAGKQPGGSGMPCNIINLVDLKGCTYTQDHVPVSQIALPFSSLVEERPSYEKQAVNPERPRELARTESSKPAPVPKPAAKSRPSVRSSQSCQLL